MSAPTRLVFRFILNIVLIWVMTKYIPSYFAVTGGLAGFIVIGALLTLLNVLLRPILDVVILPVRVLAHILAIVIVNGVFLWFINTIARTMDASLVSLAVKGGITGWIVVSLLMGFGNWMMKEILPHRRRHGDG